MMPGWGACDSPESGTSPGGKVSAQSPAWTTLAHLKSYINNEWTWRTCKLYQVRMGFPSNTLLICIWFTWFIIWHTEAVDVWCANGGQGHTHYLGYCLPLVIVGSLVCNLRQMYTDSCVQLMIVYCTIECDFKGPCWNKLAFNCIANEEKHHTGIDLQNKMAPG